MLCVPRTSPSDQGADALAQELLNGLRFGSRVDKAILAKFSGIDTWEAARPARKPSGRPLFLEYHPPAFGPVFHTGSCGDSWADSNQRVMVISRTKLFDSHGRPETWLGGPHCLQGP